MARLGFGLAAAMIAIPVRLGLLRKAAPAAVVLSATCLVTVAVLAAAIVARPRLVGGYGLVAMRLGGTALLAHLPERGFGWITLLSRRLARRLAGAAA